MFFKEFLDSKNLKKFYMNIIRNVFFTFSNVLKCEAEYLKIENSSLTPSRLDHGGFSEGIKGSRRFLENTNFISEG